MTQKIHERKNETKLESQKKLSTEDVIVTNLALEKCSIYDESVHTESILLLNSFEGVYQYPTHPKTL